MESNPLRAGARRRDAGAMLLTGPSPVTFVPQTAAINIDSVTFDLNAHTFTVAYRNGPATAQKTVSGAIPGALLTSIETKLQAVIETNEGWAAGSSAITTP
jgi:hypothetical protein